MKKIRLKGKHSNLFTIIDDEVFEEVNKHRWYGAPGRNKKVHVRTSKYTGGGRKNPKYTTIALHRMIMNPDKSTHIDHINGNPLDNRKTNLRPASIANNARNRGKQKNNSSGYKGVHKSMSKRQASIRWRAQIQVDSKLLHLGVFKTKKEAYQAYCEASRKHHGAFSGI